MTFVKASNKTYEIITQYEAKRKADANESLDISRIEHVNEEEGEVAAGEEGDEHVIVQMHPDEGQLVLIHPEEQTQVGDEGAEEQNCVDFH